MIPTNSRIYQKAFEQYLRRGADIDVSIKALLRKANERTTTHYIWRTAGDDKVRPEHAANEGHIFSWDNSPDTGHPGEAINCRCTAEPYYGISPEPGLDPVYPELLLIPFLRIPRLIIAWRAWVLQRNLSKTCFMLTRI